MKRRDALRNIGLAAGFAFATPSVFSLLQSCTEANKTWVPTYISEDEKTVLTRIVDIILPKTEDLPSATALNVPQFIDKYIASALDAKDQAMVKKAFNRILGILKPTEKSSKLNDLTDDDYRAFLDKYMRIKGEIDEDRSANPNAKMMTNSEFLNQLKWMTITAYKTTEEIGENVLIYDPVPTAYYCGDLKELTGGKSYSL